MQDKLYTEPVLSLELSFYLVSTLFWTWKEAYKEQQTYFLL
jgi:hypothetical protein